MQSLSLLKPELAQTAPGLRSIQVLSQQGQAAAKRETAAQEFEVVLGTILVRELRKSLPTGFFGEGSGADTFNGWFDDVIGRQLAASGALDLAGMVKLSFAQKDGTAVAD